jgi:hypothetical protein
MKYLIIKHIFLKTKNKIVLTFETVPLVFSLSRLIIHLEIPVCSCLESEILWHLCSLIPPSSSSFPVHSGKL